MKSNQSTTGRISRLEAASLIISIFSLLIAGGALYYAHSQAGAAWNTVYADLMLRFYEAIYVTNPYANISLTILKNKPILIENNGIATRLELDQYLGYLELIYSFRKRRAIRLEDLCILKELITKVLENKEIKEEIEAARIEVDPKLYENLYRLADEIKKCR